MFKFIIACASAIMLTVIACAFFPSLNRIGFQAFSVYVNGTMVLCIGMLFFALKVVYGK